jgi:gamma-glutamyl:cysteine ligase YbdK (ATP-grasp superfamily)
MTGEDGRPIRRSVEVEYWVVDSEGRLTAPGALVDASPGVEREFVEPLLEVKTSPCETTAALRAELFDRLGRVLDRAAELDKRLVPLATPVNAPTVEELPSERTRVQNRVVGEEFAYVRHCAGTHVHVEQQPGEAIDQLNALIALDPALALLNSSPYFRGEYLAPGARSKLYRWLAYDDLPHQGRLWPYATDRAQWARRLERRYEAFETAAMAAGVDRRAVVANFDPESVVWTPVQLREAFGTVEWRSPDAALPSQVLAVADRVAAVTGRAARADVRIEGTTGELSEQAVVLPTFDAVLGYLEAAVTEGLASDRLRAYLDRMGFDVGAYEPLSPSVARGETVSVEAARRLRLEYADRLERDVRDGEALSAPSRS